MSTCQPLALALAMTAVLPLTPAPLAATWREQVEADWLRQDDKRSAPAPGPVTREEDAAGAVDGVKDGNWGFHTDFEKDPWWQVDFGQPTRLDRVVIYNRCDAFSERTSRLLVLLSRDGRQFRQVYQHNGTVFYGATDGKPLTVKLGGVEARFLRLALAGTTYFIWMKWKLMPSAEKLNVALAKPATQSSVSQWSLKHTRPGIAAPREYPIALVLERGLKLAESQRRLGANVDKQAAALRRAAGELQGLPADAPDAVRRALYFRARWAVREMALANPLLDFDTLLFVKRAPGMFPHMTDQFYGWWSRPGGGVCLLEELQVRRTACALPDQRHARRKLHGARPVLRRPEAAVRRLHIPSRTSPTSRTRRTSRVSPRTLSTMSSR